MIENLVCTIESARRLKELGVPQESLFYWYSGYDPIKNKIDWVLGLKDENYIHYSKGISAFTAGELSELLPPRIEFGRKWVNAEKKSTTWEVYDWTGNEKRFFYSPKLAEAMALILIYLLENKLMEIPNPNMTDLELW